MLLIDSVKGKAARKKKRQSCAQIHANIQYVQIHQLNFQCTVGLYVVLHQWICKHTSNTVRIEKNLFHSSLVFTFNYWLIKRHVKLKYEFFFVPFLRWVRLCGLILRLHIVGLLFILCSRIKCVMLQLLSRAIIS